MNSGGDEASRGIDWKHRAGLGGVLMISGVGVLAMLMLVVMALNRTAPPTFVPTVRDPRPDPAGIVGPELFTADATVPERWRFFSFARGVLVDDTDSLAWDLAFRRFQVMANGGAGFAGSGGIVDLGEVPFDDVLTVPADGYVSNRVRGDTINTAIQDWYSYSYLSHLLSPKPRVYAIRTADGRYAKLQFLGYYCPGAQPGCVTFRYVFQADGGRKTFDARISGRTAAEK
ncbi:MAG: HmuY family protein [Gemmatimonadota bacterium]